MDFALLRPLAPDSIPQVSLGQSIKRLHARLTAMGVDDDKDFRSSPYARLKTLECDMLLAVSARICAGVSARMAERQARARVRSTPPKGEPGGGAGPAFAKKAR